MRISTTVSACNRNFNFLPLRNPARVQSASRLDCCTTGAVELYESATVKHPNSPKFINIQGQRFSRLVALEYVGSDGTGSIWRCVCDCGKEVNVKAYKLRAGKRESCGCLWQERRLAACTKHGASRVDKRTKAYNVWLAMKDRVNNPNNDHWGYYGGRGITICEEWQNSFEAFLNDMGEPPAGLTLDRIDVNLGYSKSNCRYASRSVQSNNTRANIPLSFEGRTLNITQWARELGICVKTLLHRYHIGRPVHEILFNGKLKYQVGSKINDAVVHEIQQTFDAKDPAKCISAFAKRFGIGKTTVRRIVAREGY